MQQPLHTGVPTATAPRFYLTGREPLNSGAILLATVAAVGALSSVLYVLGHNGHANHGSGAPRSANAKSKAASDEDEKDDPPRSIPSSSAIPPTLRCPPAGETTSVLFTPQSSFACPASATRWA